MSGVRDPFRLGDSAAGTALVAVERARAGTGDWAAAHAAIRAVLTAGRIPAGAGTGLFRGAPTLAWLLHRTGHPGYNRHLARLDAAIDTDIAARLERAGRRIADGAPAAMAEYDLISGLTGLGVYLMARRPHSTELSRILNHLVALTRPVTRDGVSWPGWWTPAAPTGRPSEQFPRGHANLGLAHGITGPLALLSMAMTAGHHVPGQQDAIMQICGFLDVWEHSDATATWWPETVTHSHPHPGPPPAARPGRASWCYGTPGIARAQQLAGLALADAQRARRAEAAMAACLRDRRQLDQLTDTGLCHGITGCLHTAASIAAASPDPTTWTRLIDDALTPRLADLLTAGGRPRRAGLLEGSAGLDLLDRAAPATLGWDVVLLTNPAPPQPAHAETGSRTP